MSDTRILAADGTPLKKKLAQSMFRTKLRAFGLVCPLLALIISAFVLPILFMLSAAVYDDSYSSLMPESTTAMQEWDGESPITEAMAAAMVSDLIRARENKDIGKVANRVNREYSGATSLFKSTSRSAKKFEPPYLEALLAKDKDWNDMELWQGIKIASNTYTLGYIANAIDMRAKATGGFEPQDELRQIHITLFIRTIEISFIVTVACLLLGYPVAYLMANLPLRTSNLLLILVLMPFWTSLLVRTTAWIAMLQGQGVMNDLFVAFGVANDEDRFSLIYNKTGTLIAMTHIMLPFMIMPLYSVMKTISPAYVRAAKSMGATNWTAFWKVYFPQSVPGIGAGSLLVFILAIGYYITPALVGGQDGQLISNMIAYHMQKSLNWSLAAALGGILLAGVLLLYWAYDRIIGIDNMKLG